MNVHQDMVFLKSFGIVLGALVAFTLSIFFLAQQFSASPELSYKDPLAQAQLLERLRPIGQSRIVQ